MRRRILVGAIGAAGLVVACSVASSGVVRPPERFQGDNWAVVTFVDIAQVDAACRQMGAVYHGPDGGRIDGCAQGRNVVLPNPCRLDGHMAQISCHELGHVNGWSHDLPAVTSASE